MELQAGEQSSIRLDRYPDASPVLQAMPCHLGRIHAHGIGTGGQTGEEEETIGLAAPAGDLPALAIDKYDLDIAETAGAGPGGLAVSVCCLFRQQHHSLDVADPNDRKHQGQGCSGPGGNSVPGDAGTEERILQGGRVQKHVRGHQLRQAGKGEKPPFIRELVPVSGLDSNPGQALIAG